jgi:hypothetical protein
MGRALLEQAMIHHFTTFQIRYVQDDIHRSTIASIIRRIINALFSKFIMNDFQTPDEILTISEN